MLAIYYDVFGLRIVSIVVRFLGLPYRVLTIKMVKTKEPKWRL